MMDLIFDAEVWVAIAFIIFVVLAGKPIRQPGDSSGPHKPRSSIPTTGGTVTRPGGFEPKPAG